MAARHGGGSRAQERGVYHGRVYPVVGQQVASTGRQKGLRRSVSQLGSVTRADRPLYRVDGPSPLRRSAFTPSRSTPEGESGSFLYDDVCFDEDPFGVDTLPPWAVPAARTPQFWAATPGTPGLPATPRRAPLPPQPSPAAPSPGAMGGYSLLYPPSPHGSAGSAVATQTSPGAAPPPRPASTPAGAQVSQYVQAGGVDEAVGTSDLLTDAPPSSIRKRHASPGEAPPLYPSEEPSGTLPQNALLMTDFDALAPRPSGVSDASGAAAAVRSKGGFDVASALKRSASKQTCERCGGAHNTLLCRKAKSKRGPKTRNDTARSSRSTASSSTQRPRGALDSTAPGRPSVQSLWSLSTASPTHERAGGTPGYDQQPSPRTLAPRITVSPLTPITARTDPPSPRTRLSDHVARTIESFGHEEAPSALDGLLGVPTTEAFLLDTEDGEATPGRKLTSLLYDESATPFRDARSTPDLRSLGGLADGASGCRGASPDPTPQLVQRTLSGLTTPPYHDPGTVPLPAGGVSSDTPHGAASLDTGATGRQLGRLTVGPLHLTGSPLGESGTRTAPYAGDAPSPAGVCAGEDAGAHAHEQLRELQAAWDTSLATLGLTPRHSPASRAAPSPTMETAHVPFGGTPMRGSPVARGDETPFSRPLTSPRPLTPTSQARPPSPGVDTAPPSTAARTPVDGGAVWAHPSSPASYRAWSPHTASPGDGAPRPHTALSPAVEAQLAAREAAVAQRERVVAALEAASPPVSPYGARLGSPELGVQREVEAQLAAREASVAQREREVAALEAVAPSGSPFVMPYLASPRRADIQPVAEQKARQAQLAAHMQWEAAASSPVSSFAAPCGSPLPMLSPAVEAQLAAREAALAQLEREVAAAEAASPPVYVSPRAAAPDTAERRRAAQREAEGQLVVREAAVAQREAEARAAALAREARAQLAALEVRHEAELAQHVVAAEQIEREKLLALREAAAERRRAAVREEEAREQVRHAQALQRSLEEEKRDKEVACAAREAALREHAAAQDALRREAARHAREKTAAQQRLAVLEREASCRAQEADLHCRQIEAEAKADRDRFEKASRVQARRQKALEDAVSRHEREKDEALQQREGAARAAREAALREHEAQEDALRREAARYRAQEAEARRAMEDKERERRELEAALDDVRRGAQTRCRRAAEAADEARRIADSERVKEEAIRAEVERVKREKDDAVQRERDLERAAQQRQVDTQRMLDALKTRLAEVESVHRAKAERALVEQRLAVQREASERARAEELERSAREERIREDARAAAAAAEAAALRDQLREREANAGASPPRQSSPASRGPSPADLLEAHLRREERLAAAADEGFRREQELAALLKAEQQRAAAADEGLRREQELAALLKAEQQRAAAADEGLRREQELAALLKAEQQRTAVAGVVDAERAARAALSTTAETAFLHLGEARRRAVVAAAEALRRRKLQRHAVEAEEHCGRGGVVNGWLRAWPRWEIAEREWVQRVGTRQREAAARVRFCIAAEASRRLALQTIAQRQLGDCAREHAARVNAYQAFALEAKRVALDETQQRTDMTLVEAQERQDYLMVWRQVCQWRELQVAAGMKTARPPASPARPPPHPPRDAVPRTLPVRAAPSPPTGTSPALSACSTRPGGPPTDYSSDDGAAPSFAVDLADGGVVGMGNALGDAPQLPASTAGSETEEGPPTPRLSVEHNVTVMSTPRPPRVGLEEVVLVELEPARRHAEADHPASQRSREDARRAQFGDAPPTSSPLRHGPLSKDAASTRRLNLEPPSPVVDRPPSPLADSSHILDRDAALLDVHALDSHAQAWPGAEGSSPRSAHLLPLTWRPPPASSQRSLSVGAERDAVKISGTPAPSAATTGSAATTRSKSEKNLPSRALAWTPGTRPSRRTSPSASQASFGVAEDEGGGRGTLHSGEGSFVVQAVEVDATASSAPGGAGACYPSYLRPADSYASHFRAKDTKQRHQVRTAVAVAEPRPTLRDVRPRPLRSKTVPSSLPRTCYATGIAPPDEADVAQQWLTRLTRTAQKVEKGRGGEALPEDGPSAAFWPTTETLLKELVGFGPHDVDAHPTDSGLPDDVWGLSQDMTQDATESLATSSSAGTTGRTKNAWRAVPKPRVGKGGTSPAKQRAPKREAPRLSPKRLSTEAARQAGLAVPQPAGPGVYTSQAREAASAPASVSPSPARSGSREGRSSPRSMGEKEAPRRAAREHMERQRRRGTHTAHQDATRQQARDGQSPARQPHSAGLWEQRLAAFAAVT